MSKDDILTLSTVVFLGLIYGLCSLAEKVLEKRGQADYE